jgi:hypothetical protein
MFLEWWMIGVFLIWWILSVRSISNAAAKAAYNEGTDTGISSALSVLEQKGIIRVDDITGEIVPLAKKS